MFSFFSLSLSFLFPPVFFGGVQRNSISPTEREKYRNARSPMAGNDLHGPDMKKIKREDKDGHVKTLFPLYIFFTTKNISHINSEIFLLLFPLFTQMSDGERSDQDLVVDDGGDVITIFLYLFYIVRLFVSLTDFYDFSSRIRLRRPVATTHPGRMD